MICFSSVKNRPKKVKAFLSYSLIWPERRKQTNLSHICTRTVKNTIFWFGVIYLKTSITTCVNTWLIYWQEGYCRVEAVDLDQICTDKKRLLGTVAIRKS